MTTQTPDHSEDHYLKRELYQLVQSDPAIFDFLQNGSLDGIWYWDLESGEDEWMSDRFWELFGYAPGEKPHQASAWQDIINQDDCEKAIERVGLHMADSRVPYDQVVRYRHKDGHTVWVRCRGLAIRDENGKPRRMLGAHTDLTPLMRSEEGLQAANLELKAKNEELQQFAYATSHDIQAPIRSLRSMLSILDEDHADHLGGEGKKVLEFAIAAARRAESLTNSILDFSRLSHSREEPMTIDLIEMLDTIRLDLQHDLEENHVQLRADRLPSITGYPTPMRLLFQNLISNGIKFGKPERSESTPVIIEVESHETEVEYSFVVRDNGIGIHEESLEQIFGMFSKLHTQREFEGTGLGLALCHRAVMLHEGRIWANSKLGAGTEIHFTLSKMGVSDHG